MVHHLPMKTFTEDMLVEASYLCIIVEEILIRVNF